MFVNHETLVILIGFDALFDLGRIDLRRILKKNKKKHTFLPFSFVHHFQRCVRVLMFSEFPLFFSEMRSSLYARLNFELCIISAAIFSLFFNVMRQLIFYVDRYVPFLSPVSGSFPAARLLDTKLVKEENESRGKGFQGIVAICIVHTT